MINTPLRKNLLTAALVSCLNIQAVLACSYPNDPDLAAQQSACAKDSSKEWNCSLNRCVTSQAVVNTRAKTQECANMPESNSQELALKKACMDRYAQEATGVSAGAKINSSSTLSKSVYALSITLAVINSFAKKTDLNACTSRKIFSAAAYGALAGELYQYYFLKNALEKMQNEYKNSVLKKDTSYEAQVKAFEYLRDEQSIVASVAKKKQTLYTLLAVSYGAAAGMAILELLPFGPPACKGTANVPSNSSPAAAPETVAPSGEASTSSFFNLIEKGFNHLFPSSVAADFAFADILSGDMWKNKIAPSMKDFLSKLGNSGGIAIMGTLCSGISLKLANKSKEANDTAEKNKLMVEEILAKFKNDMAQFCPKASDREDINKPECFCYNSSGAKNPDRTNSNTCKNFWAWNDRKYTLNSTDYSVRANSSSTGCINLVGQVDASCACKKVTNTKTGSNGCLKSNLSTVNLGSLGSIFSSSQLAKNLDTLYQGELGSGNFNNATLGKNAANIQKALDTLSLQAAKNNIALPPIRDEKFQEKLISAIASPAVLESGKKTMLASNQDLNSTRSGLPGIEEAIKKTGIELSDYEGGLKQKKNNEDSFSLPSLSGQENAAGAKVMDGFMDKERDFKDQDIVKDEGAPIWSILSKRYMTSGYRRLFEDTIPPSDATPATNEALKK